jgi:hypothetical protein
MLTACVRLRALSLKRISTRRDLIVSLERRSFCAICVFTSPFATSCKISAWRCVDSSLKLEPDAEL